MRRTFYGLAVVAALAMAVLSPMNAQALQYDQTITAIFGSGNGDGGWTTDTNAGVTVGMRGKLRYDPIDNQPKNIFNSNGTGGYNMPAGSPPSHPGVRGRWNAEWSFDSTASGKTLDGFDILFGLDTDPSLAQAFTSFNVMTNGVHFDHSLGDSSTASGAGVEAANPAALLLLLSTYSKAQNSWNMAFLVPPGLYDPDIDGTYSFFLAAYEAGTSRQVARTDIDLIVGAGGTAVPEPASLLLLSGGLLGLGLVRRKTS